MNPAGPVQDPVGPLCAAFPSATCFHCCPPIRPEDHDTLMLRRVWGSRLRRNKSRLFARMARPRAIDGRTCWALGFLDREERSVGCLLHPARHRGEDLRHLVEFGGKCARESCREARTFRSLDSLERTRCLSCAPHGDSFQFSSRSANPLFRLLAWETEVVRAILRRERERPLRAELLLASYGPLLKGLDPRVDGYWIEGFAAEDRWDFLTPPGLAEYVRSREAAKGAVLRAAGSRGPMEDRSLPMVHQHPIPLSLSRWLKFGVGLWRASQEEMCRILEVVSAERAKSALSLGEARSSPGRE